MEPLKKYLLFSGSSKREILVNGVMKPEVYNEVTVSLWEDRIRVLYRERKYFKKKNKNTGKSHVFPVWERKFVSYRFQSDNGKDLKIAVFEKNGGSKKNSFAIRNKTFDYSMIDLFFIEQYQHVLHFNEEIFNESKQNIDSAKQHLLFLLMDYSLGVITEPKKRAIIKKFFAEQLSYGSQLSRVHFFSFSELYLYNHKILSYNVYRLSIDTLKYSIVDLIKKIRPDISEDKLVYLSEFPLIELYPYLVFGGFFSDKEIEERLSTTSRKTQEILLRKDVFDLRKILFVLDDESRQEYFDTFGYGITIPDDSFLELNDEKSFHIVPYGLRTKSVRRIITPLDTTEFVGVLAYAYREGLYKKPSIVDFVSSFNDTFLGGKFVARNGTIKDENNNSIFDYEQGNDAVGGVYASNNYRFSRVIRFSSGNHVLNKFFSMKKRTTPEGFLNNINSVEKKISKILVSYKAKPHRDNILTFFLLCNEWEKAKDLVSENLPLSFCADWGKEKFISVVCRYLRLNLSYDDVVYALNNNVSYTVIMKNKKLPLSIINLLKE